MLDFDKLKQDIHDSQRRNDRRAGVFLLLAAIWTVTASVCLVVATVALTIWLTK